MQTVKFFGGIQITVYELCNHCAQLIKKYLELAVEMTLG